MSRTAKVAKPGATPRRRFWILLLLLAGAVSAGVAIHMRRAEREAARAAAQIARESELAHADDIIHVGQTLRAMQLITVVVHATVESASADETWRGDVHASVRAPVTYYYGVDLSRLAPGALRREPLTGTYTIRIPKPVRLATEVRGGNELTDVKVSGTRFRDLSGEYHLGLARSGLYDKARAAKLGEIDRRRLDDTTKTQVAGLIRTLVGDARVHVEYADIESLAATPDQPASATEQPR